MVPVDPPPGNRSAMPTVRRTMTVTADGLADTRRPVDGFVLEEPRGDDEFGLVEGPYRRWSRSLEVTPIPGDGPADEPTFSIVEEVRYKSAIPIWGPLFDFAARVALRNGAHRSDGERLPWWAPPDRFDARTAQVVGVLSAVALLSGYLGTLITQTIAFAADDFGHPDDTSLQGDVLSITRLGIFLSLVLTASADRRGRRPLLVLACAGGTLAAVATAAAPSIWWFAGTQTVSRGFATAMIVLFGIHVAEEVPAGSRAYAISALTLAAGLGSGGSVWLLPLADLDPGGWRILFLVPVIGLPLVWWIRVHLPESSRFEAHADDPDGADDAAESVGWRRFVLLASTAFLMNLFVAPAAQLQNQYLKEEIGWGATLIALFTLVTNTPRSVGVVAGGRLADTHGRRIVGVVGLVGLIATGVGTYASQGAALWIWAFLGVVGAMLVPVFGVYGPELFPTRTRGIAGGGLGVVGVAGSVVGLLVGGRLADSVGFASAFGLLAIGPAIVLVLIVFLYPETAGQELEELNPTDRTASTDFG